MAILPIEGQAIISQEELKQLLREFKSQRGESLHLKALDYFGSYARGETGPKSDIVFQTDYLNLLLTSRLRLDLLIELLKRPVDVIRYHQNMHPGLKSRLDKEAIHVG